MIQCWHAEKAQCLLGFFAFQGKNQAAYRQLFCFLKPYRKKMQLLCGAFLPFVKMFAGIVKKCDHDKIPLFVGFRQLIAKFLFYVHYLFPVCGMRFIRELGKYDVGVESVKEGALLGKLLGYREGFRINVNPVG